MAYLPSADFFSKSIFSTYHQGVKIRNDVLSSLIWVQTVWKCYQQTPNPACKEMGKSYPTILKPECLDQFVIFNVVRNGIFLMMISGPHKLAEESKEIVVHQTDMRLFCLHMLFLHE